MNVHLKTDHFPITDNIVSSLPLFITIKDWVLNLVLSHIFNISHPWNVFLDTVVRLGLDDHGGSSQGAGAHNRRSVVVAFFVKRVASLAAFVLLGPEIQLKTVHHFII